MTNSHPSLLRRFDPLWPLSSLLGRGASATLSTELLARVPAAVFHFDGNGNFDYVNAWWTTLTGFSIEQTLGTDQLKYIHPHDQERFLAYCRAVTKGTEAAAPLAVRILTRDDRNCWVELRAVADLDGEGNACGLIGVMTNVTERIQAEALHLAHYRTLSTVLDSLPGLVYRGRNNRNWSMEYISAGCLDLTGYAPDEMVNGKLVHFGDLIHVHDRDRVWNEVQASLREERPYEIVYRIADRSGNEKWVLEYGRGNYTLSGELLSLEGFITDITYGKRQQLRSAESTLYDTATGLPTRQLFLDRLQRAVVRAHDNADFDFALLLIQVDRYKRLESMLGPAGMESLLKEIAARMQATLPSTSSVTRLDDGQFAVILDSGDMSLAVMDAAANLSKAMRAPVMMSSQEVLITVSIGIAVSSSGYQVRAHMLRDADIALDRALSLGGGRVEFFDHDQQSRAAALSHLQAEFNTAADRGQLEVHWRPVRLAGDDSLVGLVAMLAWRHPRRGLLYWEDHAKLVGGANTGRPLTHYLLAAVIDQQSLQPVTAGMPTPLFFLPTEAADLHDQEFLDACELLLTQGEERPRIGLLIPAPYLNELPGAVSDQLDRLHESGIVLVAGADSGAHWSFAGLRRHQLDFLRVELDSHGTSEGNIRLIEAAKGLTGGMNIGLIVDGLRSAQELAQVKQMSGRIAVCGPALSEPLAAEDIPSLFSSP